jgi:threonine-phosphate decarboxylase
MGAAMERSDWFKLDANEGVCALDAEQLARVLSPEVARRYPRADLLEADLAKYFGVDPRQVIATAGADDAIERAFRALAGAGASVLTTTPGFVEFLDAAKRAEATFLSVHKRPGAEFPIEEFCGSIAARKPALAIVATPDNPAGTALSLADFDRIAETCEAAGSVFLLDVTYLDFADDRSIFAKALETPGVLLTGSFSKSRGLAGFRAGWAMTGLRDAGLIDRLREAGPPYSLSSPAIEAARMALAECEAGYRGFVKRIAGERVLLEKALAALGARTWPSQANFVSATVPDAAAFVAALRKEGILIRYWPGSKEAEGLVRITCPGDEAGFRRLGDALSRMEALTWKV